MEWVLLIALAWMLIAGAYFMCRARWVLEQHRMWLMLCKEYYRDWAREHAAQPMPEFTDYLNRGMNAFGTFIELLYSKPLCWDFPSLAQDQEIVDTIIDYIEKKRSDESHKTKEKP